MNKKFFEAEQGDGCHIGFYSTAKKACDAAIAYLTGESFTVDAAHEAIGRHDIKQKGVYEYRFLAKEATDQYDEAKSACVKKRFME